VKLEEKEGGGVVYSTEGSRTHIGEHIKLFLSRSCKVIGSYRFTKDLIYFIDMPFSDDLEKEKLNIVNLALSVMNEVKRFFGIQVRIGLGGCYDGIHLMHESYQQACKALEYSLGNASVVHYEDIEHLIENNQYLSQNIQNTYGEKFALFREIQQYITDNLKEDISLKDTAAKFNFSPYYFSRSFKKVFGCNFSDYLNMVRLTKAKDLLKNDSLSVKEVCYLVGYSDPNYFSKVFKKHEGVTPTEYREKMD